MPESRNTGATLLPCPFCREGHVDITSYGRSPYTAVCTGCGAQTKFFAKRAEAIEAWNTRPPAVALSALSDDVVALDRWAGNLNTIRDAAAVDQAAREAVAKLYDGSLAHEMGPLIRAGRFDHSSPYGVKWAILGARAAAALRTAPASESPPVTEEMITAARNTFPGPGGWDDLCDADIEDIWDAMWKARPAPAEGVAVPAGWKLVPVKPTREMATAAAEAHFGKRKAGSSGGIDGISMTVDGIDYTFWKAFRTFWKAALVVAPPAPPAADAGDSMVDVLLAGKPFVFDPATNFAHADDGGAPEHGIKYVPAQPAAPDDLVAHPDGWLLIKRDLYERPDHCGYTGIRDNAGLYSKEEADRHAAHHGADHVVHISKAPEFRAAAFSDLVVKHLIKQRDEAATALQRLQSKLSAMESAWRQHDIALEVAEAKVARLEGALEKIAELRYAEDANEPFDDALDIADAALAPPVDSPPAGAAQEMGGRHLTSEERGLFRQALRSSCASVDPDAVKKLFDKGEPSGK